MKIAGICGSIRVGSTNLMLLQIAKRLAPKGVSIQIIEHADLPLMNTDLESPSPPANVLRVKQQIAECDAVLIATPEYNFSIPAPLKNVIDWASRPGYGGDNVFDGKPVAIMSSAGSAQGGVRAQLALRHCFNFLNGYLINKPMLYIGSSYLAFDENGELKNKDDEARVGKLLVEIVDFTHKLQQSDSSKIAA